MLGTRAGIKAWFVVYEKKRNVKQVEERWVWIPDASTCRIKIAHPTTLNQYDQYLMYPRQP